MQLCGTRGTTVFVFVVSLVRVRQCDTNQGSASGANKLVSHILYTLMVYFQSYEYEQSMAAMLNLVHPRPGVHYLTASNRITAVAVIIILTL
ncbi:hypothetical protein V1523DRAFT_401247 [Lipomyces doorenjongii]